MMIHSSRAENVFAADGHGLASPNDSSDGLSSQTTQQVSQSWSVGRSLDDVIPVQSKHMTIRYSWGSDRAPSGQVDLQAWICTTGVMGKQWLRSGKQIYRTPVCSRLEVLQLLS